ncbi:hypothetical protein ACFOWA_15565 [Pedobacter lithocola]|uniref:Uncharacterized protein n=1 Tax=Pedobacter lithocola TaxID=1908239 RepID=A0ABV8PBQ8_9SPHI
MKRFLVFFLAQFWIFSCFAQKDKVPNTMHQFLQKNADSTILYNFCPSFLEARNYLIVSKKGDTISIYTYGSKYIRNRFNLVPKAFTDTLQKLHNYRAYIDSYKIGINVFFDTKYISRKDARIFWNSLLKLGPWKIKDDDSDGGAGCTIAEIKKGKPRNYATDGGGISLGLITKNNIEYLHFDNPWYFESKEGCPGRKGRIAIIEI